MDFESATRDLYRVAPHEFTAARDAAASEARNAGQRELAIALKKVRKPSVGAWLANLLVREQSGDIERLLNLGAGLRHPRHSRDGEQIRRVSKDKSDAVSKLVRDASSIASREGQSVSAAALQELEATLDAAFADPQAAENLLRGHLTSGLHYSGLGFTEQTKSKPPAGTKGHSSTRSTKSEAAKVAARRSVDKANDAADQADAHLEQAKQAVVDADNELRRLKSAESLAERRSREARSRASAAKEKLSKLP